MRFIYLGPWRNNGSVMDHLCIPWQKWYSIFAFFFHCLGGALTILNCEYWISSLRFIVCFRCKQCQLIQYVSFIWFYLLFYVSCGNFNCVGRRVKYPSWKKQLKSMFLSWKDFWISSGNIRYRILENTLTFFFIIWKHVWCHLYFWHISDREVFANSPFFVTAEEAGAIEGM